MLFRFKFNFVFYHSKMPRKKAPPVRVTEKHTFFYTVETPFSQFYRCSFLENDVTFTSAEQYMMYNKAILFEDHEIAACILEETVPNKIKALGRKVRGFSDGVWLKNRERIVKMGNILKFSQNANLKEQLIATGETLLVEASPRDCIWGIGLGITNEKITDEKNWRGTNLLGKILTEVRDELKHNGS